MKTTRRITPTALFDLDGVQSWLDDMASRGYFLVRWGKHTCLFREDSPDPNLRYHLEPVRARDRTRFRERRRQFYDLGWDYVCTGEHMFHIFAAWDPFAPEPETDAASMLDAMAIASRSAHLDCAVQVAFLLISALFLLHMLSPPLSVTTLLRTSGPLTLIQVLLIPLALVISLSPLQPIRQIRRSLRQDEVLPRSTPGQRILIRLSRCCALLVLILAIVDNGIWQICRVPAIPLDPAGTGLPLLTLSQVENREGLVLIPPQITEDFSIRSDEGTFCVTESSFWCPAHYLIRQEGSLPGVLWTDLVPNSPANSSYRPFLTLELWDIRSSSWADSLYSRIRGDTQQFNREKRLSLSWARQACSYTSDASLQMLVFRTGGRVMTVTYQGEATLTDFLPHLEKLMEADWTLNLSGTTAGSGNPSHSDDTDTKKAPSLLKGAALSFLPQQRLP